MSATPRTILRIGTRKSRLARIQTAAVVRSLEALELPLDIQIVPVVSAGDRDLRPFSEHPQRGIFVSELQQMLLDGEIDVAVHSMKDLAYEDTSTLRLAAIMEREDPRDCLASLDGPDTIASLDEVPVGATIATASARRKRQLAHLSPDVQAADVRGNVQTRLKTASDRGDFAAMLAVAGLNRLQLADTILVPLSVDLCVPEAGQGAVCIQIADNAATASVDWSHLHHEATAWETGVERLVAAHLGAGCSIPVGVHVSTDTRRCSVFVPSQIRSQHADCPEVTMLVERATGEGTTLRGQFDQAVRLEEPEVLAAGICRMLDTMIAKVEA